MPRDRPVPIPRPPLHQTLSDAPRRSAADLAGSPRVRPNPASSSRSPARGSARTTEVRFLGQNGGSRAAGFRIVSDRELKVEVPEAEATTTPQLLTVETAQGLAVTVPRNQTIRPTALALFRRGAARLRPALFWIGSGEMVNSTASQLVFVSPGGLVTQAEANRQYFVQHDGRLGDSGGNPSAVFFEPGAILPDRFKRAPIGQPVPVIVPSPVDQTFVIVRAPDVRR